MGLGADTMGSRIILWPGTTTTDWYGLGMASSKMVYNVPAATTHTFYTEGVSALSIYISNDHNPYYGSILGELYNH